MKYFVLFLLFIACPLYASSHHPEDFLKEIRGRPDEGQQIVNHFCISCHAEKPLIQLGAPRIKVLTDWKPRLIQGLRALFQHAQEGINAMPARGGCFECDDEQLLAALMAMLPDELKEN